MDAGAFWAAGARRAPARSVAEFERECAELGINVPDDVDLDEEPSDFSVLPENWDALELFLSLQTQWRHAPMGGLTGLDYSAVRATMQMHDIPVSQQRQRLDELQLIERGALGEMSNRSGK